ncbi:MAG: imelysin family protein [Hyphomicrobiales bacterium]
MTRFLLSLCVAAFCMAPSLAQETGLNAPFVKSAERVLVNYIRPSFKALQKHGEELHDALDAFCNAPNVPQHIEVKEAFKSFALSFARVEVMRFGPLVEKNRLERLYFWPDRRGLALKRVQRALAEQDESVLKTSNLRSKSIALQGLGGLEFLLFGTGSDVITSDAFRCQFAAAIAGSLANTSKEVATAWLDETGYSQQFLNPNGTNTTYRSKREVGAEILNVMKNSTEAIALLKLGAVLGETPKKAKPKRAPLWRSGLSVAMLNINIASIFAFQKASGILTFLPKAQSWIIGSTTFEYENVGKRLQEISLPITEAVLDDLARGKLIYAHTVLSGLTPLYSEDVAPSLGLQTGFNALDGD